jgi:hypothetical protein
MQFMIDTYIAIFFGTTTVITSVIALRYARLDQKRKDEEAIGVGRQAVMFLSRSAMLKAMLRMYDEAKRGDEIWVQCVGCANYSTSVRSKVLEAAGKGVTFRLILNKYSPSIDQLRAIYDPLNSAQMIEGTDNALRIQGLSDKEVIVGLPGVDSYTGLHIKDPHAVKVFKQWYDQRFQKLTGK